MKLRTKPMSDVLGIEVEGVDISRPLDAETRQAMRACWLDGDGLLLVRNCALGPAELERYSRAFGELAPHALIKWTIPEYPFVSLVSNVTDDEGQPIGPSKSGRHWHSDAQYLAEPATASVLHSREVPPEKGETMFANMYAAYNALDDNMKKTIETLRVLHSRVKAYNVSYPHRPPLSASEAALVPDVVQPMVRVHPETGRRALYVGGDTAWSVIGWPEDEGKDLIRTLRAHAVQDRFVYGHKWRVADTLLWDNRCLMHRATPFDEQHRRLLIRTHIKGGPAFGPGDPEAARLQPMQHPAQGALHA
jgi:taurine dioxygenase